MRKVDALGCRDPQVDPFANQRFERRRDVVVEPRFVDATLGVKLPVEGDHVVDVIVSDAEMSKRFT